MRRTDRAQAYYCKKSNLRQLQNVLLSYAMYNFDLGYVQASSTARITHPQALLACYAPVVSLIIPLTVLIAKCAAELFNVREQSGPSADKPSGTLALSRVHPATGQAARQWHWGFVCGLMMDTLFS